MSETRWTAGPWVAGRSDMATIVDGFDSKWVYSGEQYVAVASGRIEGSWDEVMANAHLIAAAPDLYEALKAFVDAAGDFLDRGGEMRADAIALVMKADTALAKARGENPNE